MKSLAKLYVNGRHGLRRFGPTYLRRHSLSTSTRAFTNARKGFSYVHGVGTRPLVGVTTGQLVDLAPDRFGDQFAVIDCAQEIRKTHVDMKKDIDKLATGLLALNLQRGDRIAIWCPNKYEWIQTHLAACKAGLILVTINPAFQPNEFAYCLSKVGVRALVFPETFKTQNYYEMILKVVPDVADSKPGQIKTKNYPNFDTLITLSDKDLPGTFKFKDVTNAGGSRETQLLEKLQNEIQFDDVASIQFTSGTTGKPKAASLSHFTMINNCINRAIRSGDYEDEDESMRICNNVPLFHCYGAVGVSLNTVAVGTCAVLPSPGYSAEDSLKAIEKEKCTTIYGTPTMFVDMLSHPNFNKTDLSSLQRSSIGGASPSQDLCREVENKLNITRLGIGYGLTESGLLISCHSKDDDKTRKFTHMGRPVPHTEVKIVDVNNKIVPLDTPGEICVRGYNMMKGYWEDEDATKEAIKDGWLHTGDMGTLTEDGYVTMVGRIKDMIIRGGENIYPKEIEDYLITHPKISDVYVIGVPDQRMGEEICAWILPKPDESMTENEVKEFCKKQIAHFKIPRYVRFVDSFPMTATRKVQKFIMRQEMVKILEAMAQK